LNIEKGKITTIVGPSGAGKSTLLHVLAGLEKPSEGRVFFEDRDLYALNETQLSQIRNKKVGFVFQFYHLLSEFTALENVLLPGLINNDISGNRYQISRNHALRLLEEVGLSDRKGHFPNQLSGGEQQRTAIARALINNPEVLFCDEPTGNLDEESGREIICLLKRLNKENKTTVVLVSHNPELAKMADYVFHIKDGILATEEPKN
jgi:ABC-type lipoprotein export system ATPase subunit